MEENAKNKDMSFEAFAAHWEQNSQFRLNALASAVALLIKQVERLEERLNSLASEVRR